MAIYHASAKIIKRSSGRSATGAAAYRSGEQIIDRRTGLIHDYRKKSGVGHTEILAPANSPIWVGDRSQLWNSVEESEKRKDSQLAREFEVSIPKELTPEQGRELVKNFAQENFVDRGMVADICHHDEDGKNPHAHILLTTREISSDGFGKKNRDWNDKNLLKDWRKNWEESANQSLKKNGHSERIDHRSLAAQGVDREPQIHHANRPIRIARNKKVIENEKLKRLQERLGINNGKSNRDRTPGIDQRSDRQDRGAGKLRQRINQRQKQDSGRAKNPARSGAQQKPPQPSRPKR